MLAELGVGPLASELVGRLSTQREMPGSTLRLLLGAAIVVWFERRRGTRCHGERP